MRPIVLAAAGLLGLLLLTACAGTAAAPDPLAGRQFLSTGVTQNGADRPLVAGTRIRLSFSDGHVGVSAGCNSIGGSYRLDGGTLVVDAAAMTEMGCDPDRHAQDDWLADFLSSRPSMVLNGNDLTLASGATTIRLADREVADPDVPLTGPHWTVVSVVSGDTVSSVPEGVEATISFAPDGAVQVTTGCNTGTGRVMVDLGTIRFSELALTRRACIGSAAEMERAVLAVLGARNVAYAIEARTLSLSAGDRGLQLRAD